MRKQRVLGRFIEATLAKHVAARFAMEFPTENALHTYLKKHPKAKPSNHSVKKRAPVENGGAHDPRDEARKPSPAPATAPQTSKLTGIFSANGAAVDAVLDRHRATFDSIDNQVAEQAESFETEILDRDPWEADPTDLMSLSYKKLSTAEKRLHVGGHLIGQKFEASLEPAESKIHDRYMRSWQSCSSSWDTKGHDRAEDFEHTSQELQGLASAFGVSGHADPTYSYLDKVTNGGLTMARDRGGKDPELRAHAKKMYDYQQAYFKNAGIRELTLYRGVKGPPDEAETGAEVRVESRELASFTGDPNIAKRFGRPIAFKVPVERVFASSLVAPAIGSETCADSAYEAEFVIMGASDLVGTAVGIPITRARLAAAKKKVIVVPITVENADWLHNPKKKEKRKPKPKKRKGN